VRLRRFFRVHWQGEDTGGSGLKCFDVQVRDGDGPWQDWQTCTTSTSAVFVGRRWHVYRVRSRAMDNAGNVEAWPEHADAWTYILGYPSGVMK
jgi:predicted carbohydrate-binding protein with CBM5 and CBM33 domain